MRKRLIAATAAAAMIGSASTALYVTVWPGKGSNQPEPLALAELYLPVRQSPVEQFAPAVVTNQSGCAWDPDDNAHSSGVGYLNADQSATHSYCRISAVFRPETVGDQPYYWDMCATEVGCLNITGFLVYSDSPNLIAKLCVTPTGRCWMATPVGTDFKRGPDWAYLFCVRSIFYYDDSLIESPPPNTSGGGHGVTEQEDFTVTNPTGSRIRNIAADMFQYGWAQGGSGACAQQSVPTHSDYPFMWSP